MCILHIKLTLKLMLSDNINISFKQIISFKTLKKKQLVQSKKQRHKNRPHSCFFLNKKQVYEDLLVS